MVGKIFPNLWYLMSANDENISNYKYIGDISMNILTQNFDGPKINQNLQNVKKNF